MIGALVIVGMGLLGLLLWRRLAPRLHALRTEETTRVGGRFVITAILVETLAAGGLMPHDTPEHSEPLGQLLAMQALVSILGLVAAWIVLVRSGDRLRSLGVHAQRGPPAVLVGLAAWLTFLPVLMLVKLANTQLLDLLGVQEKLQDPLLRLLQDPAARSSPLLWLCVVLVLPACEEVTFRGALYAALRRLLHPALAVAASAILFGLMHETSSMLPAAALGAVMAVLYERTGSLGAPLAFHALQNGMTTLIVAYVPGVLK